MADDLTKLRNYARQASIVLMRLSGGGSEMFTRIGKEFYAEPELCAERIQHRRETEQRLIADRAAIQAKGE